VERFTAEELASLDPLIERMTEAEIIDLAHAMIELQAALQASTEPAADLDADRARK